LEILDKQPTENKQVKDKLKITQERLRLSQPFKSTSPQFFPQTESCFSSVVNPQEFWKKLVKLMTSCNNN